MVERSVIGEADTMRLTAEVASARLDEHVHGVFATLHPTRGPDPQPVVYAVHDGHVGVPIDQVKPKKSSRLQREDNLAASGTAGQRPPGIASLFRGPYLRTSVAILVTSFMGLLLVYGLNTWLPKLMQNSGYDLGNSLAFLLVLNVGAVAGLLVAGRVADRIASDPETASAVEAVRRRLDG